MKFWSEVDGLLLRQAAKQSDAIRAAFISSINVAQIVERWTEAYPTGGVVSAAEARTWAGLNIPVKREPLTRALAEVYAIGWVMGRDSSTTAYAQANVTLKKAAPSAKDLTIALNTNWDTWKPGNRAAALLVKPSGKFAQLLEAGNASISGMNATTLNRVGTILADSLQAGKPYSQVAKDLLNDQITSRVVTDSSRAITIAVTEMSRALNVATMDNYATFGVEKIEWLAIDTGVCEICPANEAQGPIPLGEMFESGDTEAPAHPNCRCTVLPVVDLGQPMTDEEFAQAIINGDTEAVTAAIEPLDATPLTSTWQTVENNALNYDGRWDTTQDEIKHHSFQRAANFFAKKEPEVSAALARYTSLEHKYMNQYLRDPDAFNDNATISLLRRGLIKATDTLVAGIAKAPALPHDLVSYRGIYEGSLADRLKNSPIGTVFTDKGFFSTTTDRDVADTFVSADPTKPTQSNPALFKGVLLKVLNPAGTKGIDVLGFEYKVNAKFLEDFSKGESEWLLPPGTSFEIVAKSDSTITVVVKQ